MTHTPHTVDRSTAQGDVVDLLEEEIVLGLRFPRERLVEDDLMDRFGAKRHIVRRALQELENRGLVERTPNIGAFVKVYTAKDVRDIYAVRELLEGHCAQIIQLPVEQDRLDELISIQRRHDAAVAAGDLRGIVHSNTTFHHTLFALSDNNALVEAIRRHAQMTTAMRSVTVTSPELLHRAQQEHWQMIRALEEQNTELLADTARAHLLPSRDAYLQRIAAASPR
ncbi:GntR family transcriptional regulator [Rhodococcus sp. NPDC056960]|uniref:GntR family transcriptional regulator n=1 Tax=Rhodococcus sp. NPDC056960 TaxID=3345982 RepID=UPI00363DC942